MLSQLEVSAKQHYRVSRPPRATKGANGNPSAVAYKDRFEHSVLHSFNSRINRFPIHLLPGIVPVLRSNGESAGATLPAIAHRSVAKCLRSIGRNPRLRTCDLMSISGLSRRGLHKAFETHLGCSPGAIMIMVRMWTACDLLANSRLPVIDVATSCGYRSSNSLYVAFQRYLGVTPVEVRRRRLVCGGREAGRRALSGMCWSDSKAAQAK